MHAPFLSESHFDNMSVVPCLKQVAGESLFLVWSFEEGLECELTDDAEVLLQGASPYFPVASAQACLDGATRSIEVVDVDAFCAGTTTSREPCLFRKDDEKTPRCKPTEDVVVDATCIGVVICIA